MLPLLPFLRVESYGNNKRNAPSCMDSGGVVRLWDASAAIGVFMLFAVRRMILSLADLLAKKVKQAIVLLY